MIRYSDDNFAAVLLLQLSDIFHSMPAEKQVRPDLALQSLFPSHIHIHLATL
jgi:hypothetical protein